MAIAEESFNELFPGTVGKYSFSLRYSGKFSSYNANVRLRNNRFVFGLSSEWKGISEEIQKGLIQLLILRVLKKKMSTHNIDLYNSFMKSIHIAVPKNESSPELVDCFERVNEKYFNGLVEKPNLAWCDSVNKLGSYEFGRDKISISRILAGKTDLLDYVMYHEMLHKKHKFSSKSARSFYHTRKFRDDEKAFEDSAMMEKELRKIVRREKVRRIFF